MTGSRGPISMTQTERALRGNPGKRQTPASGLDDAPVEAPPRPKWLDAPEAKREWTRVVRELKKQGRLAKTDRALLAAYCSTWARLIEVEELLDRTGYVTLGTRKTAVLNPTYSVWSDLVRRLSDLSKALGLNIAARARLPGVEKQEEEIDPADELRARRERRRRGA